MGNIRGNTFEENYPNGAEIIKSWETKKIFIFTNDKH